MERPWCWSLGSPGGFLPKMWNGLKTCSFKIFKQIIYQFVEGCLVLKMASPSAKHHIQHIHIHSLNHTHAKWATTCKTDTTNQNRYQSSYGGSVEIFKTAVQCQNGHPCDPASPINVNQVVFHLPGQVGPTIFCTYQSTTDQWYLDVYNLNDSTGFCAANADTGTCAGSAFSLNNFAHNTWRPSAAAQCSAVQSLRPPCMASKAMQGISCTIWLWLT